MQVSQQELHMGPVPAPDTLAGYERVVPGSAERILIMAEKDAENVRLTQRRAQTFLLFERLAARLLSAFFASGALATAAYLALEGHDTVAGVIAGTTIVGVATALVMGRGPASDAPQTKNSNASLKSNELVKKRK